MSSIVHEGLLAEIEAFCEQHSVSKSKFGDLALGDPRLVFDIKKGRELRRSTEQSVRHFMAQRERGAA